MIKSVFVALAITNWSDPHYGIAPLNFGKDFKCAFWPAERAIEINEKTEVINVPLSAFFEKHTLVSFSDLHEIKYQKKSTDPDSDCGIQRLIPHVSGGLLDRLCGGAHAFLGSKIRYLPLAGFFFAALAGIGGGIILDNLNRERRRNVWAYWALLLTSLPTGAICLLLGLP